MIIEHLDIDLLQLNEGQIEGLPTNPRTWTAAELRNLAKSLKETPEEFEARPILAVKHGDAYVVLGGNMRLEASRKNGAKEVPVIVFPETTPVSKLKEIVIKDNGSFGDWDYDALANEWDDLPLPEWGVPAWETEPKQEPEIEDDGYDETQDEPSRCKKGDIYQLGDHILMCGDNGIFKGVPLSQEEKKMAEIARFIYRRFPTDGKYIIAGEGLIICQSNAKNETLKALFPKAVINPLGEWTGGIDVDSGATNRKLGSDMARGVTGGGLHGKDLSKADVSVNIYEHLKAQETGIVQEFSCAIGDQTIDGKPYAEIVKSAREYIQSIGGFEKFAEWGLF